MSLFSQAGGTRIINVVVPYGSFCKLGTLFGSPCKKSHSILIFGSVWGPTLFGTSYIPNTAIASDTSNIPPYDVGGYSGFCIRHGCSACKRCEV